MMNPHKIGTLVLSFFFLTSMVNAANPIVLPSLHAHDLGNNHVFANFSKAIDPILSERGLLKQVDDVGYPFVNLTIEFPERKFSEQFTFDLSTVKNVDAGILASWVGKYVAFDYSSNLVNALIDLQYKGQSVLNGESVPAISSETKSITGILSNAAEETQGDLPGEIYIQTEEEITEKFPFFITSEIVKLNGKNVIAYYEQRTQNTIHKIKLIK